SPPLASGTGVFDPSQDAAGTYTYTITGTPPCADSTASVTVTVDLTPNAGNFTANQTICNTIIDFDLFTLLDGTQQSGGTWTNNLGDVVSNLVTVSTLPIGLNVFTYNVTNNCGNDSEQVQLTIISSPTISIEDIIISTPICQGSDASVTLFNLADGSYFINYNLSGSNTVANQNVTFNSVDGEATFEIDSTLLVNTGTTIVAFNSILNTVTTCQSNLSGIEVQLEVLPIPTLQTVNLQIQNVCFGSNVNVQIINALNLPNGQYQFSYSIPGANPVNNVTGNVTIQDGAGQFEIPSSIFTTAGLYNFTLNAINNSDLACSNSTVNVTVAFEILAQPIISEAQVSIVSTCVNTDAIVTITNASQLQDGNYQLTYLLSNANIFSETITVNFTGGSAQFTIPSSAITNAGSNTLTINQILSSVGNICGNGGNTFEVIQFTISSVQTPELIEGGNVFCEDENPTILNLTNGIIGNQEVIWYDAPINGTIYSDSALLQNGITYYAVVRNENGCESETRLAVTVELKDCTEIIIPDGFSPNNDGINDSFVIKNLRELYPNFTLEIFNRYGNILYKGNAASPDWDGTSDKGIQIGGNKLPVGVYFFIINFNDGNRKPLQGRVYLSR
ncbi:MAG: gliding motility-associated C-terminal domain-containing protein, partial [Flavobacteriales bacterium]|nr:gliding motility-associated C-terminal domain-containing protein [Flavobacteriales bacterium]